VQDRAQWNQCGRLYKTRTVKATADWLRQSQIASQPRSCRP
jgi:hypothetical protein